MIHSRKNRLESLIRSVRQKAFICGCGHSGTSLIANILAGHPDVYIPRVETGAFLHDDKVVKRVTRLFDDCVQAGKTVLVEKTPRHIRRIDLIRDLVPGACFIIPVRDGRDVAASIFRRSGDLNAGMKRWINDNSIVALQSGQSDVLVYRHEDLVENAECVVRQICSFIGVSFSDDLLRYHEHQRTWFGRGGVRQADPRSEHEEFRNWQINQPIFDGRGTWKQTLSSHDFNPLKQGTGALLMQKFGYVPDESW